MRTDSDWQVILVIASVAGWALVMLTMANSKKPPPKQKRPPPQESAPPPMAAHVILPNPGPGPKRPRKPPTLKTHLTRIYLPDTNIIIRYRNVKSDLADRLITIKSATCITEADGSYTAEILTAFCYEAKAMRAFRVDRITHFTDPKTGEVTTSISHLFANNGTTDKPSATLRKQWVHQKGKQ